MQRFVSNLNCRKLQRNLYVEATLRTYYNTGMKTLRQSLIDYELVELKAIADCRAVPLKESNNPADLVDQLVEALLSPVATAIALDDLSAEETEALQFLLAEGGQVEAPRFIRHCGDIRQMGPARLEREQPWNQPATPAEGLWYRAIIFKTFQVTAQGGQEVVYIPDDLLGLLRPPAPAPESSLQMQVGHTPTPAHIIDETSRLRENFFNLSVYLQTTPVRLQNKTDLPPKARQELIDCLLPPFLPTFTPAAELAFLLHLGRRAGLLTVAHGRLRPDRDAIRSWLQAAAAPQIQLLQNTWRADPTWNDLWHVPSLVPQDTGWENSPLRARSKILDYLEQLDARPEDWRSLDDFVASIKRVDPDFQRPAGDYESWYIQDQQGNFLMGFEHWDQVEGAFIRYLLTHILPLLGVLKIGAATPTDERPTCFSLTAQGRQFLAGHPAEESTPDPPAFLRADANFYVQVPPRASLYDRFQLARFAHLDRRENHRAIYQITRASISRAAKNGVTIDQIIAFLTRATNNQIPLRVVETLRTWGARYGTLKLEQLTVLRLRDEKLLPELRQDPAISRLLASHSAPQLS